MHQHGITAAPPASLRLGLAGLWMLKEGIAFLNHGSFGATPRAVFDAQNDWRRRIEAEPVEILGRRCGELVAEAKRPIGQWLGMAAGDFGFTTNATDAINAVLRSIRLSSGDELLTTDHVYNAVRQAMRFVADRAGATYREVAVPLPVRSADEIAERVLGAIGPKTRLLVIDHITSPTALIFPVERIIAGCAEKGVDVLVDGAHAPGMVELDVQALGAAYYAGNLHKWACAPKGSGFLWVRPDRQADIHPLVISHLFEQGLEREFGWQGTRDFSAWFATPAALAFMADLGWDRVRKHNHEMAIWAHQMLCQRWSVEPQSPLDGHLLGSTASVRLPAPLDKLRGDALAALQQRLYSEFRIEVPLMQWGEQLLLRVSCQVYNTPDDYHRAAEAIERVSR